MIKVGIVGATGRMGRSIIDLLEDHPRCKIMNACTSPKNPLVGQMLHSNILTKEPEEVFENADVVVDFTTPKVTEAYLELAKARKTPMVIGTSGLSKSQEKKVSKASESIPIVYAANTSIGVALMQRFAKLAAQFLDDSYDIEILEAHHRHKVDAPSGTALALGRSVAEGRGVDFDKVAAYDRCGERKSGDIGLAVQRGGSIIGEHSVQFIGEEEVFALSHRGLSRSLFARGAIRAAEWVVKQEPGLYTMENVIS